ncbi:MAG: hypothetical protein ABIV51_03135 [Saprospiraceae bacterium]
MIDRILTRWTFTRLLYLGLGTAIMINSAMNQQWIGVLFGAYFASMGLFAFGCAAGNCYVGNNNAVAAENNNSDIQDIEFEEIKHK